LVVDAPAFDTYWDRAFCAWKDYVNEKEVTNKGKMAAYEPKKGKTKKEK
jgi:hypothetical protein